MVQEHLAYCVFDYEMDNVSFNYVAKMQRVRVVQSVVVLLISNSFHLGMDFSNSI